MDSPPSLRQNPGRHSYLRSARSCQRSAWRSWSSSRVRRSLAENCRPSRRMRSRKATSLAANRSKSDFPKELLRRAMSSRFRTARSKCLADSGSREGRAFSISNGSVLIIQIWWKFPLVQAHFTGLRTGHRECLTNDTDIRPHAYEEHRPSALSWSFSNSA